MARIVKLLAVIPFAWLLVTAIDAQDQPAEAPEQKPAEQPADADGPFDTLKALREHFEPLRGALATEWEDFKRTAKPDEETFKKLREKEQALFERERKALRAYLAEHTDAEDAIEARHGVVMISANLGQWQDVVAEADAFLAKHKEANADLTRIVSYSRADALLHIEGKEEAAATALEAIVKHYPGETEANMARELLIVAYTYLNRIADAKRLVMEMQRMPEVESDEQARAFFDHELAKLNKIGERFPEFVAYKTDGVKVTRDGITGQPLLVWYWDIAGGTSLPALPGVAKIAKEYEGKLKIVAISVERNRDSWKQEAEKLAKDHPGIVQLYEGVNGPDRSAASLIDQMPLPMAVLVTANGTIHRLDVPAFDLARVVKRWLAQ
ncbi:MAG: hypothetical protein L6Q71_10715 [Planctomycetes bacterium]|nr:hypothetical protein [Planctomycetota bacterium]NUQ35275.1 hypothetical protein [Planctomycetaceae bacterium]